MEKRIITLADIHDGILLIDKPQGISSYDVIRRIKGLFSKNPDRTDGKREVPKIGHAGTLDPRATGLMIIGIGSGTKTLTYHIKLSKTYITDIVFGVRTETGDLDGQHIYVHQTCQLHFNDIDTQKIFQAVESMVGEHFLPVPIYSAIKKDGKKLYEYARENQSVEIPIKKMSVEKVRLLEVFEAQEKWGHAVHARIEFSVSSGTYIRTLAEELGRRLGTYASLAGLRRMRIGDFHIEQAFLLPERR